MLKLTIVGRINDGLPLAQGPRYMDEENSDDDASAQKQQAEFLLREISTGALPPSKMTIFLDHHCFKYASFSNLYFCLHFENGVLWFITYLSFCMFCFPVTLLRMEFASWRSVIPCIQESWFFVIYEICIRSL